MESDKIKLYRQLENSEREIVHYKNLREQEEASYHKLLEDNMDLIESLRIKISQKEHELKKYIL